MKLKYTLLFILFSLAFFAQEKATISGYIKDSKNGESLIGATIYKMGSNSGASANEYGFYSLTLPKGPHVIAVSLIGYATYTFAIELDKNITKNIEIGEEGKNLEEVVITGEAEDKNITSVEMSAAKLDIKQINKIPALLGEVDVIRSIQLLPGVTTIGEGASGFNVRGV
jgi:CarboxypepD_reg-like domain